MGAAIVLFLIVMGGLGPVVAPFDPTEAGVVLGEDGRPERFKNPGFNENLLGGDRFARDVLSRLLHGARISLMVGVAATVLGCSVGAVLGVVSGYVGGKVDAVLSQLNNMILAFPVIIMAMALLSGLERNLFTIIVAIAIPMIPIAARVVRSTALVIKETQYVEAARAIGASSLRITFLHVMPGCLAPLLVITTSLIGVAILTEAFLGFLGLSIPPPRPTWGEMLSHSTQGTDLRGASVHSARRRHHLGSLRLQRRGGHHARPPGPPLEGQGVTGYSFLDSELAVCTGMLGTGQLLPTARV